MEETGVPGFGVERNPRPGMVTRMSGLRKILAMTLVLLWLPAVMHCRLETLPGLDFLACCDHGDVPPHQDEDCQQDGCASVESGLYKTQDERPRVVTPELGVAVTQAVPALERIIPAGSLPLQSSAPPELRVRWQFAWRAALSPRAPTSVS